MPQQALPGVAGRHAAAVAPGGAQTLNEALRAARQHEPIAARGETDARRAGIEGTLARGIRRRLRRTRYRGQPKVHLGHLLAATGLNSLRLGGGSREGRPEATTLALHPPAGDSDGRLTTTLTITIIFASRYVCGATSAAAQARSGAHVSLAERRDRFQRHRGATSGCLRLMGVRAAPALTQPERHACLSTPPASLSCHRS